MVDQVLISKFDILKSYGVGEIWQYLGHFNIRLGCIDTSIIYLQKRLRNEEEGMQEEG